MFYDYEVKYTELEGKIYPIKNKGSVYITLELDRTYFPEKKYTKVNRTVIGKPIENKPGYMNPNGNFEKYFPSSIPQNKDCSKRYKSLNIGEYVLIKNIVDNLGVKKSLLEAGFDEGVTAFILDFASYQLIEQNNTIKCFENYQSNHPLFSESMSICSYEEASSIIENDIIQDDISSFFDIWNKNKDKQERVWCSFDSTNINCKPGDINFTDYEEDKNIIEYSVVYDKTNHIPLNYEFYSNDILDTAKIEIIKDNVQNLGYKNIGFILDKGYFSKSNIQAMDKNNMPYIIQMNENNKIVQSLIDENKNTFEKEYESKIKSYEQIYGKYIKAKVDLYDDIEEKNIYLFFNTNEHLTKSYNFMTAIEEMENQLQFIINHPQYKDRYKIGALYKKFFELEYDDSNILLNYKPKYDVIDKEVSYMGYFCIIYSDPTEEKLPSFEEVYKLYKSNNSSKKVFDEKIFLDNCVLKAQYIPKVLANKFISFIASIIRNEIHYHLFTSLKCLGQKYNYMNVPIALNELGKIVINEEQAGSYTLGHALNEKEKNIFEAFNMTEQDIYSGITNIIHQLSKQFI